MAISINDFRMAIRIDNSEAKTKFAETKEQIAAVRAEMDKLAAEGKKNSDEYKALKQRQDELNKSLAEYRKEGVRTSLSYAELRKGASQLKREMDRAIPGTEEWKALRQDYLLTKKRMRELEVQARDTRFSLSKMADGFNRYAAIGTSAVASLTGVVLTARKCVDEYAEMQEAESQVIKYTGMTKEEVAELNEEFKHMDTRTPREKLNALAGDAGRLGITGKKGVLDFVDAANQINVALGEDLGEDAVKNIGKLSQMFGDANRTLRENMLATGSAVNTVAQNSSAAEPYLIEFAARMGGVAKQAKLTITDVLGFASALDQNMLRSEMASTALQGLILKIYQEPAKYAKLAKMDVEEFTTLIDTDVNEALLRFLESLGKLGGMDKMAPILKEMKLSGAEAAGVISALAGNVEKVRKEQKTANDAFREGTSITNEYNVQNNTVQAGLDKAKEKFKNVRVELGEKLLPVMKYMITIGSMTVKGLGALVSILSEYKGIILSSIAVITAYTAAVKAQELWTKRLTAAKTLEWLQEKKNIITTRASRSGTLLLSAAKYALSGNIKRATVAMKAFNAASKANLLGILASLALGAGVAIYKFATRTSDAEKAVNSFLAQSEKERSQLRKLTDATKAAGEGTKRRKELIEEINTKYGQYLPYLLNEYSSLKDIEQAYRDINTEMDRNLARKVLQEKSDEIQNESMTDKIDEMNDVRNALIGTLPQSQVDDFLQKMVVATDKSIAAGNTAKNTAKAITKNLEKYYSDRSDIPKIQGEIQDYVEVVEKAAKRITAVKAEMNPFINKPSAKNKANVLDEVVITPGSTGNGHGREADEETQKKELKARMEKLKEDMQKERNLLKQKLLDDEKMTKEKYQQELYKIEVSYLLKRKALLVKFGKDASDIQGQIYDKMIAEADRLTQAAKDAEKNSQSDNLAVIDEEFQAQRAALKQAYISGGIKREADYLEKLKELERQYLNDRRDMLAAYGEDTSDIDTQLLDMDYEDKQADKEKQRKNGFQDIDNTSSFKEKNRLLKAMYDADLITFEEYQDEKARIAEEREQQRIDTAKAALDVVGQATSAASQVINALQDAEISKVSRKYDKQIKAAKKAGKDTTKLEEEKEEAINQVKKKYADKQFAAAVLQVTATTAVTAMEAYKAMAGIPLVGPALGAAAAAAAVASGAAQIAVAKQQRDEAKGLKSGGYSDEYVEGYTRNGNPDDVAGVIPVHKNEFVTNHEGVANPHVRQFLDVFDMAQKNGTIRMLNTTQILEQVRTRSGKYSGGYSAEETGVPSQSFSGPVSELTPEQRLQIVVLLQKNNELLKAILDKELVVDPRKVRDGIKRVEMLEGNVRR
jgi:TP901 family phage tail tape measure protein